MDAYEISFFRIALIIGVTLGCIIAYFVLSVFQYQRRQALLQRQHYLKEFLLLEQERKRIAHDLHDEVGPLVSLTQMQLGQALESEDWQVHVAKAQKQLQEAIRCMGAIAVNLIPKALEEKGLVFALEQYLEKVAEVSSLMIEADFRIDQAITPATGIHVYRMMQEIIHNTIKHAHANCLHIVMKTEQGLLYLSTKDDGCGFVAHRVNEGMGMSSIKSRVALLGGSIHCVTGPGKGTAYLLKIPLAL